MRKIDLVYLWVDGNDTDWLRQKNEWLYKITGDKPHDVQSSGVAHYRDNDELRYSLRSAAEYAPWLNHIYIITGFGQVPKWLNTKHPKITIVDHSEIFPSDALPTFNSNAIEMCVMNIPGLSEHFLLANDDTFFGKPLTPDFFFDSKGRAITWYTRRSNMRGDLDAWADKQPIYNKTVAKTLLLFRKVFNKDYFRYLPAHNIDGYVKSSMMSRRNHPVFSDMIDKTIHNKFRDGNDIQRWYFNVYSVMKNTAVFKYSRSMRKKHHIIYNFIHRNDFKDKPVYTRDASVLKNITPSLFCLNDTEKNSDKRLSSNRAFLEQKFPNKSEYEK